MRPLLPRLLPVLALLALTAPVVSSAAVPNPATSSLDPCMVFCPAGDITFHVTVRDAANNPVGGSAVVLDLSHCPNVAVCPNPGQGILWDPVLRLMKGTTDVNGHANFPAAAGGLCSGVPVSADGILLGTKVLTSPDQNGDLIVDWMDRAILNGKLFSADPTGDLDCNGTTTVADVAYLEAHWRHTCGFDVPTLPQSWGRLKIRYR